MAIDLSKPIEFGKKKSSGAPGRVPQKLKGHLPSKTTINLAGVDQQKVSVMKFIPALIIILVLAVLFSKFLVIDRMNALSQAQSEQQTAQQTLDAVYAKIDSYGELTEKYAHYTYSGMTESELTTVSRKAAADLIEKYVLPTTSVSSWSVSGNVISLPITGLSLQEINQIVQNLQTDELVAYCTVNTAATNEYDKKTGNQTSYDGVSDVTAQVSIYLNYTEEGAAY